MRYQEFSEQMTTPTDASISGDTSVLSDPKIAAAQLAQRKKQQQDAKARIMAQISALNKELADINAGRF